VTRKGQQKSKRDSPTQIEGRQIRS